MIVSLLLGPESLSCCRHGVACLYVPNINIYSNKLYPTQLLLSVPLEPACIQDLPYFTRSLVHILSLYIYFQMRFLRIACLYRRREERLNSLLLWPWKLDIGRGLLFFLMSTKFSLFLCCLNLCLYSNYPLPISFPFFLLSFIAIVCVCECLMYTCGHLHHMAYVEVRGHLVESVLLFLYVNFEDGTQVWWLNKCSHLLRPFTGPPFPFVFRFLSLLPTYCFLFMYVLVLPSGIGGKCFPFR